MAMTCSAESAGISINELASHLRLSRNYITRNITHCVKHVEKFPAKGAVVRYDERDLRAYLTHICTFSRQTKRINLEKEFQDYIKQHPDDKRRKDSDFQRKFIGKIPKLKEIQRSEIPFIPLEAMDFWEFPLIFPQEYSQGDNSPEAKRKTAELCYRDMFKIGAIKIQLGRQKTMFYIPKEEGVHLPPLKELSFLDYHDPNCFLVPADWKPFYEGHIPPKQKRTSTMKLWIEISTDSGSLNPIQLEQALRKGFVIDYVASHKVDYKNNLTRVAFQASMPDSSPTEEPQREDDV